MIFTNTNMHSNLGLSQTDVCISLCLGECHLIAIWKQECNVISSEDFVNSLWSISQKYFMSEVYIQIQKLVAPMAPW